MRKGSKVKYENKKLIETGTEGTQIINCTSFYFNEEKVVGISKCPNTLRKVWKNSWDGKQNEKGCMAE